MDYLGQLPLNGGDIHLTPEIVLLLLGAVVLYVVFYVLYPHLKKAPTN